MGELVIFVCLLGLGFGVGSYLEKKHYQSIREREEALRPLLVISSKHLPEMASVPRTDLVRGSVVVSIDYFKRFLASLRMIFGGRLGSYESLIDRGRREAILRMKEEAKALGATMIFNVRFETSSVFKGGGKNSVGSIEVLAYGTAIIPRRKRTPPPQ
jgi:uncharacterized protein YbjQ (UPF0145 family)